VSADRAQLEQVLANLVTNARDATEKGGRITIGTERVVVGESDEIASILPAGEYGELTIDDSGTGMAPEVRSRLFEPFFTTKETGRGTGLGLSTTYGIVKQSRGYIWVYSEPGLGTTFKVYLPCGADEPAMQAIDTPAAAPATRPSETVLLVEDEPGVRHLSKRILHNAGYRVMEAVNGDEAERLFAEHGASIDLVVTDVVMPGCGGPELLARLQARAPALRVLYMSGYTDLGAATRAGIDRGLPFLQKPFTAAEFVRHVRDALDR
jgi:CheY-like chemotaxis protein